VRCARRRNTVPVSAGARLERQTRAAICVAFGKCLRDDLAGRGLPFRCDIGQQADPVLPRLDHDIPQKEIDRLIRENPQSVRHQIIAREDGEILFGQDDDIRRPGGTSKFSLNRITVDLDSNSEAKAMLEVWSRSAATAI